MDVQRTSYSTTSLSEYIGSHIYEMLGMEVHDTRLGVANRKVVVGCKDFFNSSEVIFDYNSIKNEDDENVEKVIEDLSSLSIDSSNDFLYIKKVRFNMVTNNKRTNVLVILTLL